MNYYQIIPKDYVLRLQSEENYKKAGAFMNYWFLFFSSFKSIEEVEDEDIEKFKKRYSVRTLGKIFDLKGHQSIVNYREEFIEVIANFISHWKLKNLQNQKKVESAQKEVEHFENTSRTNGEHFENTKENTQSSNKSTEKTEFREDLKKEVEHSEEQTENISRTEVEHFENEYINNIKNKTIKNKKIINKEWFENFLFALSKVSRQVSQKRYEFESVFMSLFTLYDDVEEVIEWASKNDFWMDKLIDPRSIRRNFEKMRFQMLKEKSRKPIPNGVDKVEQIKEEIEALREIYERKLKENKEIA